jgi:hypothetical protein
MGDTQVWLSVLLYALPSIIVFILGMIAASDKRTGQRWADLLYQAGAVGPAQRDEPKIRSSVRWPFIVVAVLLLYWPVSTYIYATRKIDITSDLYKRAPLPSLYQKKNTGNAAGNAAENSATNSAAPAANGVAPAQPPSAPANIYGTPLPR